MPDLFRKSNDKVRIEFDEVGEAEQFIRAGVWAEDNPNARARHHFHDPTFAHDPPTGNHGLDDQKPVPFLNPLGELITFLIRGGDFSRYISSAQCFSFFKRNRLCDPFATDPDPDIGNFEFRGRSALDRALNRTLGGSTSSSRSPENFFAFPDAERYLYRGLTASTEEERSHYLALHFVAFGHVLHLLQDQSSPGHVRNDFVTEHALRLLSSFEAVGDKDDVAPRIFGAIDPTSDALFTSRPRVFLSSVGNEDPRYSRGRRESPSRVRLLGSPRKRWFSSRATSPQSWSTTLTCDGADAWTDSSVIACSQGAREISTTSASSRQPAAQR